MVRLDAKDDRAVSTARSFLQRGSVVILPTDTLYGFSAAMTSRAAYEKICMLKQRPSGQPFVHLASDVQMVERWIESWGCTTRDRLEGIWPAPLTGIFASGAGVPEWIGGTIAFRVPNAELVLEVCRVLGEPIVSTSVNRSGEEPLTDVESIDRVYRSDVDLLVESSGGGSAPSTLVDFTGLAPRVVRRGSYAWAAAGKPSN